jgi:hypothetical protein
MAYVVSNLVRCIGRFLFEGYSTTTDAMLLHRLEACSHLRVYAGYTVAWRNIGKQATSQRVSMLRSSMTIAHKPRSHQSIDRQRKRNGNSENAKIKMSARRVKEKST